MRIGTNSSIYKVCCKISGYSGLLTNYLFNWFFITCLTLKWPRYFYSHGAQGVQWNPPKKTTFPPEFCNEICTIYVCNIKNHNSGKNQNVGPFQNGGQITDFYFSSFRFWPKFEKPLSQRNFSEIWLKVGEHE